MSQNRDRRVFHDILDHFLRASGDNQIHPGMHLKEFHQTVATGIFQELNRPFGQPICRGRFASTAAIAGWS